jgi:hypothetical protein
MIVDIRLVAKGKAEPRDGLLQQGKVQIALAKQHATELADAGWPSTDTDALAANVADLEAATGAQAKAYNTAGHASAAEAKAIADAKGYIRKLRHALPRALREANAPGVTLSSFHAGERLGRSTPKISKFLATIRPAVAALDPALKKHFKGKKASTELDAVKAALDHADTTQELARKNAPGETLALYEVMGRVLEQIEDLNRAGKIAFDGDAATRAKFNKDVLLRARKERPKKKVDAAKPEPSDGAPPERPVAVG